MSPRDALLNTYDTITKYWPLCRLEIVSRDELARRWHGASAGDRHTDTQPAGVILATAEPSTYGSRMYFAVEGADLGRVRQALLALSGYVHGTFRGARWTAFQVGDTSRICLVRHGQPYDAHDGVTRRLRPTVVFL